MASLQEILNKKKPKQDNLASLRPKLTISDEYRPYDDHVETGDKLETRDNLETRDKLETGDNSQTGDNLETRDNLDVSYTNIFKTLSQLQKSIVFSLYDMSKYNKNGFTDKVKIDDFSPYLSGKQSSVKKTIARLEKNLFVERVSFKNGKGGWTIYKLNSQLLKEIQSLSSDVLRKYNLVSAMKDK